MINKRMAILYIKASIVIFVLCFTVVQLASIHRGAGNPPDLQKHDLPDLNLVQKPDSADLHQKINPDSIKAPVINEKILLKKEDDLEIKKILPMEIKKVNQNEFKKEDNIEIKENQRVEIVKENQPVDSIQEKEGVLNKPVENDDHDKQIEEPAHKDAVIVEDVKAGAQIKEPMEKPNLKNDARAGEQDGDEAEDDEFPAHNIKKIEKLRLVDLQPPDHMDGVKMEQDGHLNRDYKKEIILGNHEEFEKDADSNSEDLLEKIFAKVDKDGDHFISLPELEDWIIAKVQEHFDEANEEAERIFKHLDTANTGFVSWQDFHVHFLVAKGYEVDKAKKHIDDYETLPLDPDEKERLIRYKFRWAEADEDPQDNKLTMKEFKSFRHPEQSPDMLERMVQDIIDNLDQNNDGEVTEDEFIALPPGEVDGAFIESDHLWQDERRKEFKNVIDMNKDGKVNRSELKNYVDPQNPNHARLEAENLVQLADDNKDGHLSLEEVLDNAELFLGSKMVDTGRNFHDEF